MMEEKNKKSIINSENKFTACSIESCHYTNGYYLTLEKGSYSAFMRIERIHDKADSLKKERERPTLIIIAKNREIISCYDYSPNIKKPSQIINHYLRDIKISELERKSVETMSFIESVLKNFSS